jgi:alginate O-acetyltransferase complex protein AlgI
MLFQSQVYLLAFLPLTVACFYAAAGSAPLRQWVLIVASLIFYGWWDPRFVILVLSQITVTWLLSLLYERFGGRAWLTLGIFLNLASLGTFKYLDFLIASLETGTGIAFPRAHLILPIGISFFSFQLISYLVDRMRGDAPLYSFRPFALFVLIFPHVIAGPIVRHNELIPQFGDGPLRAVPWDKIGAGLVIFAVGLAKKVLLADRLAQGADPLFAAAAERVLTFGEAWTAVLAFSLQLFLDFSAYTEMAIGSALLFGLILPENFRRPYLATDLRDFWRRWHISLSKFLRDYLYIPLGGSRHGPARFVMAIMVTMGLCGLWHGAGWTYVIWGVWHGVGLIACHAWQQLGRPLPVLASWAITMLFVLVGWVIFRSSDFGVAASIIASLTGLHGFGGGSLREAGPIILGAIASVAIPSAHEMKDWLLQRRPIPALALASAVVAIVCVFEVGRGAPVSFIYFQF